MAEYRITRSLSHADDEREDHKYIARVETGNPKNKWRYFYTREAYQAYLKSKQNGGKKNAVIKPRANEKLKSLFLKKDDKSKEKNLKDKKKNTEAKNKENKSKDNEKSKSKSIFEKGKEAVEKFFKNTSKKLSDFADNSSKTIEKGKKAVEKFFKNTSKKLDKLSDDIEKKVDEGKKVVEKFLKDTSEKIGESVDEIKDKIIKPKKVRPESFDDLEKKDPSMTSEEDQAAINPNYDGKTFEYAYNCQYCTMTYMLRQEGYDVEAAPAGDEYNGSDEEVAEWYGLTMDEFREEQRTFMEIYQASDMSVSTEKEIAEMIEKDMLSNNPEGSYGHFDVYWTGGGGHSIAWEIDSGEVIIRDCQTNETFDVDYYIPIIADMSYYRTDDLDITDAALEAVVIDEREERRGH